MKKGKHNNNEGFLLISVIIVLAIILIWAAIDFKKSNNGHDSLIQTKNKALEQTEQNNALLLQENQQNQDELNSLDSPPVQTGHGALNQARSAVQLQNQNNLNSAGQ